MKAGGLNPNVSAWRCVAQHCGVLCSGPQSRSQRAKAPIYTTSKCLVSGSWKPTLRKAKS